MGIVFEVAMLRARVEVNDIDDDEVDDNEDTSDALSGRLFPENEERQQG